MELWEAAWLLTACVVITALSIYWNDTIMGIISAVTGVAYVVCTRKGKLSAYIFGTINVVLYAIISYQAKYYGEVMLNALYYLPMEFYGFYVWNRHSDYDYCHCLSGSYKNIQGRTRFYFRCLGTASAPDFCRQLVYTAENILQDGFGARRKIIYA